MDDSNSGLGEGIFAALRSLGNRLLSLVANRLQLFSVELQEEKLRLLDLLLGLVIGLVVGGIGLVLGTVCLALWLKEKYGFAGLGLVALLFLGTAAVGLLLLRQKLKAGPKPFAQTIAEFKKDAECLRPKN